MTIWKFEFEVADAVSVTMPQGAKVIHVGTQNPYHICLWAMVNPESPVEIRNFCVRGTGHSIAGITHPHLGSVKDGPFVWHVFGEN
jgi:hypothetical protein